MDNPKPSMSPPKRRHASINTVGKGYFLKKIKNMRMAVSGCLKAKLIQSVAFEKQLASRLLGDDLKFGKCISDPVDLLRRVAGTDAAAQE